MDGRISAISSGAAGILGRSLIDAYRARSEGCYLGTKAVAVLQALQAYHS
jgi:hypothetical protein